MSVLRNTREQVAGAGWVRGEAADRRGLALAHTVLAATLR
jgi:hypothetical protein